jgi:hypothetical protein
MEGLEIKKNKLREKVEKIYNAFKKFNTVIERGGVKFKFTIILPPVPTINFKEVGKINDFGLFVYDEDGEIYIDKLEPYLIIPKFYIIYDEEMIENLEWSQKPDYMWLESKIKEKILKNFKNFKTDVSHFGKAFWRTFEKTNLDDTSDLWNPNFKNGLLSESWDVEKPLNHLFADKVAPKYELLSSAITDQERNHLKKRAQKIYHTYNNGSFTAHLVSDETTSIDLKINYSLPDVPYSFNAVLTKPETSLNGRLTSYITLLIPDIKLYIDFDNPYHQPLKDLIKNSLDKSGEYYIIPTKGKKRGLIVTDIILQAFKEDIVKNFKRFNINIHLRSIPKPEVAVNESWDDIAISEGYTEADITDEKRNKIKKVFNALRTGTVTVDSENILNHKPTKYKYVMNPEYHLEIGHQTGKLIVFPDNTNDVPLKVYRINDDGSVGNRLFAGNSSHQIMIYDYVTNEVFEKIQKLFKNFKIHIEP